MKIPAVIWILILVSMLSGSGYAIPAGDYVQSGRLWIFQGTLTGLRNGYDILDAGMNDPGCPDCQTSRQLIFFHTMSRITMWAVRNDGAPTDSVFELAEQNQFSIVGSWIRQLEFENNRQINRYDAYDLPSDLESIVGNIATALGTDGLAEMDSVLQELDRITETPADRFRIFLTPEETHAFMDPLSPPLIYDLEVDYADVLMLKGILSAIKAAMHTLSAYDLNTTNSQEIIEKMVGDCFSINADLLLPNPEFFKILPADGAGALARARQAWIEALTYYQLAMDAMEQENIPDGADPQEDELFYIESEDQAQNQKLRELFDQMLDSFLQETPSTYTHSTCKTYPVQTENQQDFGSIRICFDLFDEIETGRFTLTDSQSLPVTWQLENIEIQDSQFFAVMSYPFTGTIPEYSWGGGYLTGQIDAGRTAISNLYVSTWGYPQIEQSNLTAAVLTVTPRTLALDLNPLLRSTDPVSPIDLLPDLNAWNTPAPSTMGHGIGSDPTLGGILPDKTHLDWNRHEIFQPTAQLGWQEIYPWQKVEDWTVFWLNEQLVFEDAVGDLLFEEDDSRDIPGADIAALYLGYDFNYLHGEIVCQGPLDDGLYRYDIKLSYSPTQPDSPDSLRVLIHAEYDNILYAELWYRTGDQYGYYWSYYTSIEARMEGNFIDFRIPWWAIPGSVNGRYLTIESTADYGWAEDNNATQIQIGMTGSLSGTVSYDGFIGAPIYIQAFTDINEQEESIVASTMITAPGTYQLTGIGLGWQGYIRAFTPLFGINLTDLDAIRIETMTHAWQRYPQVKNINLTLTNPAVLQQNNWTSGRLHIDSNRKDVYAFDAIEGVVYFIEFESFSPAYFGLDLMGRNGDEAIFETGSDSILSLYWICPVSGRYYFKVENWYWDNGDTADYQIRYTSDTICPAADISGSQWAGVRDCSVDSYDFDLLAANWLDDCSAPYWCDDADFNKTHRVDMADFVQLANQWLTSGLLGPDE